MLIAWCKQTVPSIDLQHACQAKKIADLFTLPFSDCFCKDVKVPTYIVGEKKLIARDYKEFYRK